MPDWYCVAMYLFSRVVFRYDRNVYFVIGHQKLQESSKVGTSNFGFNANTLRQKLLKFCKWQGLDYLKQCDLQGHLKTIFAIYFLLL